MKKLILGLCLTVGASASVFAGNGMVKNNMIKTKTELKIIENRTEIFTQYYVNSEIITCTIATHTMLYDTCGNYVYTFKESYEATGAACTGVPGGIKIKVKREMTGFGDCPANY